MKEGEGIQRWLSVVLLIIIIAFIFFLVLFVLPRTVKSQNVRSFTFQVGNKFATVLNENGITTKIELVAAPVLKDNQIFIAVRDLENEYFGAKIEWNPKTKAIIIYNSYNRWKIIFSIGKKEYYFNGKKVVMDTAPFIDPTNNRSFIPVRYFAEVLGANQISYCAETMTITITWPSGVE